MISVGLKMIITCIHFLLKYLIKILINKVCPSAIRPFLRKRPKCHLVLSSLLNSLDFAKKFAMRRNARGKIGLLFSLNGVEGLMALSNCDPHYIPGYKLF
jgi:hypothetical protein